MNFGQSFEEESSDDPIILIDDSDTSQPDYTKVGYKSASRTSFVPITFFDITNNVRLLSDCRPLYIKVVDCDKHPWYYRKFYKRHDTLERNDPKENTCPLFGVDDRLSTDESIHTVPIDYTESKLIDIDAHNVATNKWLWGKNRKVKYTLKRITSTKSILTINRNKSSKKRKKKKSDLDFKRNKGLIGLKITQTSNIIDIDGEPRTNMNKIEYLDEHEKMVNSKQFHTNISDDESLKQLNTYPIAKSEANIHCINNNIIDKTESLSLSMNKKDTIIQSVVRLQDKVPCKDNKRYDETQSLSFSTNKNDSNMYSIAQSQGTIHSRDNKTIDNTQSLYSNINKKSLSPIFPCKPPSNNKTTLNLNNSSSVPSLGQSKILTDTSFQHSTSYQCITEIPEDSLVNEATEKVSTQDNIIHTQTSTQKSTKPFLENEIKKVSTNSVTTNSQSNKHTGLLKPAQITVTQPSFRSHESSSPILPNRKLITNNNKQYGVINQWQPISNGTKSNTKGYQTMPSHIYYGNNTLQYNRMNEANICPTICPTHKSPFEKNCSLTESYNEYITSSPFPKQNHRETNLNYMNYMNVVVGMGRNHTPVGAPNMSQMPYSEIRQVHYNNPPPALQRTDYYRMEPTFSNPAEYSNFHYPDFRQPYFRYRRNLSQHTPSLLLPPPPFPHVSPPSQVQAQSVRQTISSQYLEKEPSNIVPKKQSNLRKFRKLNSVNHRKLQVVTDSTKMCNLVTHSTTHGHSSKVVKHLNEEMNLKKSSTSISQTVTIVESKVEMLQELEKEMLKIHGEVYNTNDNSSKTTSNIRKEVGTSKNKNKDAKADATQNLYNVRQNNELYIPFTLQETALKNDLAPDVEITIKDNRNYSDSLVSRNHSIGPSLYKSLGLRNTPVSPSSKKSKLVHNFAPDKNVMSMNSQSNGPKPSNYSPPILPIPSYDKTFEILTRATFEAKKYLDKQKSNNTENKHAETANIKIIPNFESYYDRQDRVKKISVEEYKIRKLHKPTLKNINQKYVVDSSVSNDRNKNFGDACRISDLDQGYGSDSTVTI